MDDDQMTRPGRRPSAMAMLAAGALGAAVLGLGGVAYAQTADPTDPGAAVTQEEECEEKGRGGGGGGAGGGGGQDADATEVPSADPTSSDA